MKSSTERPEENRAETPFRSRRRWFCCAHFWLRRIDTERAWALNPSASPSAIAAGPSARNCSGPHLSKDVRFMKSSTPKPDENLAERAVGSTWFEPAT